MDKKILVAFVTAFSGLTSQARTAAPYTQVNDTIARDLSDLESMLKDSVIDTDIDTTYYGVARQRNFNALKFSLDGRHRYVGDEFKKNGFSGHTYIEFGGGTGKFRAIAPYHFTPQTNLHLSFGKDFNSTSSIRVGLGGGVDLMKTNKKYGFNSSTVLWTGYAGVDYLFNFSNYICGYRPDRPLQVSGILGVGVQQSKFENFEASSGLSDWAVQSGTSFFFRPALQFKFFAGSHSALAIEPYAKYGTEKMDMSLNARDGHIDLEYGVNLSYIYYFDSYLSDRAGDLRRRYKDGSRYFNGDSAQVNMRSPFFFEYSMGPTWYSNFPISMGNTMGHTITANVGMWLSSAIGWRAGLNGTNADWTNFEDKNSTTNKVGRITKGGLSFDALLNPFGFQRNYNWDSQFGVNLFTGVEYGRMRLTDTEAQRVNRGRYVGYRAGLQLWTRLADDLRLNIEPLYTCEENYVGRLGGRVRYDEFAVKAGLTVLFRSPKHRSTDDVINDKLLSNLFFGAGLGWNSSIYRWHYSGYNTGLIKNGMGFVGYDFNDISAVKLNYEYLVDHIMDGYYGDKEKTMKTNLLSLDYQVNLLNLMTGYKPSRRWNLHVFGGPTYAFGGEDVNNFGFNVGGQLSYRVTRNLSLFYSHTAYWLNHRYLQESDQVHFLYGTLVNSLNIGLIYNFNSFKKDDGYGFAEGHPTFVEYGIGMGGLSSGTSKSGSSWGTATSVNLGYWINPAFGLRLGFNLNKGIIGSHDVTISDQTHTLKDSYGTASLSIDALVNPFGFRKDYTWDKPFGVNLIVGYQRGLYSVSDDTRSIKSKKMWFGGLRYGAQLWAKLSEDLRFYIEPIYSVYSNDKLYVSEDGDLSKKAKSGYTKYELGNNFAIKTGLTLFLRKPSVRNIAEDETFAQPYFFVGLGGGINDPITDRHYDGSGSKLNGILFGGYRFNEFSSVRASLEYMDDNFNEGGYSEKTKKYSFNKCNSSIGLLSLDYQLDVLSFISGYRASRPWEGSIYAGIAGAMRVNSSLKDQNGDEVNRKDLAKSTVGINMGMLLEYKFNKSWSVFYNHNIYGFGLWDNGNLFNTTGMAYKVTALSSFNIGIIRKF